MSKLTRIVYPVFEVKDIEKWTAFADQLWGLPLQKNEKTGESEAIIDDTGCRIIFRQGKADDLVGAGWEADDLDGLFDSLKASGANPEWQSEATASSRGAARMFTVADTDGLRLEIVDKTTSSLPVVPSRHGLEFEAGKLGFGHITLISPAFDKLEEFYTKQLGMGVSDYIDWEIVKGFPLHLGFFHSNPRHHSMASGQMKGFPKRMHHFMLQVKNKNQVGTSFDRIRNTKIKVANDIGVHPNDHSFSFYVKSPSGFEAELGADGLDVDIDDPNREIATYDRLSIWGHKMSAKDALPLKAFATFKKWTGSSA